MARKPRLHLPGAVYHVIHRGNARSDIFFGDDDRKCVYDLLNEGVRRFGYRVHAFCLMRNHMHFALQAGAEPLSAGMQNLAFRFTRYLNARRGRSGHVFEGRYKAFLVDHDRYLLELVRYIHLNPVRAGVATSPEAFPASGHLGYLGRTVFSFLTTDWVLGQFSDTLAAARRGYSAFVAQGMGEGHRDDFYGGAKDSRVIGEDRFAEQVLDAAEAKQLRPSVALEDLFALVSRTTGVPADVLEGPGRARDAARARALIGWLAVRFGEESLCGAARRLNRDLSTLSRSVASLDAEMRENSRERRRWENLAASLSRE